MSASPALLTDDLACVLFDLDGTLLDTAPDLVSALHAVCAEESVEPPAYELAAGNVSNGAIGLTRLAFPHVDASSQERLCARLVETYRNNICMRTRPYPGVVEMLAQLERRSIRWGVVTNKLEHLAGLILAELDLRERCAVLVGGDTAARNKPHPDPIEHALRATGHAARAVAYVGDHEKDIIAGRAAGVRTIAVTWGYILPEQNPFSWGADYTIERPEELFGLAAQP